MEYEIVIGLASTIDTKLKSAAPEGWVLHTFVMSGMATVEGGKEKPVFTAVLQRASEQSRVVKTERKYIGQKD